MLLRRRGFHAAAGDGAHGKLRLYRAAILDAEGHYKGVITEGDLLWAFKRLCVMDIRQTEEHSITEIAAPRRAVQPVRADTRVEDLIAVAADQNFVPVVDDKDDFIGIVTRSRILKYCLEQYFVATVY